MLKKLILNTGSNLMFFVIRMVVTFFMTPVFVKNLGNYDYSVWELVTVVVGYMGLLDLGIRPAVSRFVAYYKSKKDLQSLLNIYSTSIAYMMILGVVSFLVAITVSMVCPDLIAKEVSDTERYKWLLIIVGTQLLITFPGQIAESCLEGLQKYYLKNNITIVLLICNSSIIYHYITPENALLFIASITTLAVTIKYTIYYQIVARQKDVKISFSMSCVGKESLRKIFAFSLKTFIQGTSATVIVSIDKIVISLIAGVDVLIYFLLPSNLTRIARDMMGTLTHAMMPFFAELYGVDDHEKEKYYFLMYSKFMFSLVILNYIGIYLLGSLFISYWIGAQYGESVKHVITGLVISNIIDQADPVGSRYLTAINRHGILAKTNVITALLATISSLLLVQIFGYIGAGFSGLIPGLLVVPYVLSKICSYINISIYTYFKKVIFPSAIPGALLFILITVMKEKNLVKGIPSIILIAFVAAIFYYVVYFAISMSKAEKTYICSHTHKYLRMNLLHLGNKKL